ncbi:membrane-bound PQQ-dependent dehydrogenase, glucose/quinate/shikimate family [Phyllobacterium sp. SB3]|uniref:membrane-bound PQQ-dependent dehydrogenase, glucose/quinate/shikimate family n=1 Tax=Phyllobacterium sp. SB3 TaxID=3156073 RepID=UPI0032AF6221
MQQQKTCGDWAVMAVGLFVLIFGAPIFGLGLWLISLGGSWYYALAGLGLLITSWFLFRRHISAFWVYLITFAGTVIWALWERGLDGWAQVPRLVAPTVVLILVFLSLPVLRRDAGNSRLPGIAAGLAMLLVLGGGTLFWASSGGLSALAQSAATIAAPEATPSPTAQSVATKNALPGASATPEPQQEVGNDWPAWGGTNMGARYSPLSQINTGNVTNLKKIWTFETGDTPSKWAKEKYSWENTPITVNGRMYTCSPKNILYALDPATGREWWRYDPKVPDTAIAYGANCHAVAYYAVPNAADDAPCTERIIESTLDARLIAVDAKTGQLCQDFGTGGMVDLHRGMGDMVPGWYTLNAAPIIVRGVVVVGGQVADGQAEYAPSGVIRGYSATTGKLVWAWDIGRPDKKGEPGPGEEYTRNTPNMWTVPAADEQLGLVYLPLGNAQGDYYGGHRQPYDDVYNSSVVAVDATTGKDVWHFQTVHHDIWDYDLGSQPSLVNFPTEQGNTPALILPSKQGEIYVLDRRDGKPLFPVIEKPVPQGGSEPVDRLSKTQPFSGYSSLNKPDLTEADMWGMTPLDQLWCRIQFRQADYRGVYTPPSVDKNSIEYPSYNGGSDWGSIAVDEKNGILVANYNDMANFNRLVPRDVADKLGSLPVDIRGSAASTNGVSPQAGAPYAVRVNAGWVQPWTGMMCKQPPYGGIKAIDLKTGKTLWDKPLGLATENGPFGIPLKLPIPIGLPNNGGAVLTAGGLVFIAAATDNLIRAIDIKTGETLWSDKLPGGGQANPMTFEARGQQYLVITDGGHHFMKTPIDDSIIAYALPRSSPTSPPVQPGSPPEQEPVGSQK